MSLAPRSTPCPGATLAELLLALTLLGILLGMAGPPLRRAADRHAVRAAARTIGHLLGTARQIAATGEAGAAVAFDTDSAVVRLTVAGQLVRRGDLGAVYGVGLSATRDSVAYDSRGLGVGAANVTVAVTRGAVAETLVVSRLGRLRGRW